jgi:hypothetical protein
VANAIARIFEVRIGLILHPALTTRLEITAEIAARHIEQWPDNGSPPRIDSTEALHSGSANQLQEKRLCLIVASVPDGDPVCRCGSGRPVKEVVPKTTSRVFDRQSLCQRIRGNVDRLHRNRKTQASTQVAAELFVTAGRATKAVIQVSESDHAESALFGKLPEQQNQRDGIGTTGHTNQNSGAG